MTYFQAHLWSLFTKQCGHIHLVTKREKGYNLHLHKHVYEKQTLKRMDMRECYHNPSIRDQIGSTFQEPLGVVVSLAWVALASEGASAGYLGRQGGEGGQPCLLVGEGA